MASTLAPTSEAFPGLQADIGLSLSETKHQDAPDHALIDVHSTNWNHNRSPSVPNESDTTQVGGFPQCMDEFISSPFSTEDDLDSAAVKDLEFYASDILSAPAADETDGSPSDAVVPTPVTEDADVLSMFDVSDVNMLDSFPLSGLESDIDGYTGSAIPTAEQITEFDEIKNQLQRVKKEIEYQKQLMKEAREKRGNRSQLAKLSIANIVARHASAPLPEGTIRSTWSPVEAATLQNVLVSKYPADRFCPAQQALLSAQHLRSKSAFEVGKRLWWMREEGAAIDSTASKRPRASQTQTLHQAKGVAVTGSLADSVKNLLERNESLLAMINDNISKMKFAANRDLMEVFVQNVATIKQILSDIKPEGLFMPQLKNVDIAKYVLHDSCRDALPPVLLNSDGRTMQSAMQRRVAAQHHQQLLQHQQMLHHQQRLQQQVQMRQHNQHLRRQQPPLPQGLVKIPLSGAYPGVANSGRIGLIQPPQLAVTSRRLASHVQPST